MSVEKWQALYLAIRALDRVASELDQDLVQLERSGVGLDSGGRQPTQSEIDAMAQRIRAAIKLQ